MRVLGVDPGTVATGWGVVELAGPRLQRIAGGVIRLRGPLGQRLAHLHDAIGHLLATHAPTCVSLETPFVGENVQSAFRLGEARGAILVAAARAGVAVHEYSPAEIKVAVVGSGRAGKQQMQTMVAKLLMWSGVLATDEADALGAAICHLHTQRFVAQVGVDLPPRSRRPRADRRAWERTVVAVSADSARPVGPALRARRGRA